MSFDLPALQRSPAFRLAVLPGRRGRPKNVRQAALVEAQVLDQLSAETHPQPAPADYRSRGGRPAHPAMVPAEGERRSALRKNVSHHEAHDVQLP